MGLELFVPHEKRNDIRIRTNENDSILRTLGANGMSINKELEKKEMRLLASRFDGTSIADSFTVSNKYNLLICEN